MSRLFDPKNKERSPLRSRDYHHYEHNTKAESARKYRATHHRSSLHDKEDDSWIKDREALRDHEVRNHRSRSASRDRDALGYRSRSASRDRDAGMYRSRSASRDRDAGMYRSRSASYDREASMYKDRSTSSERKSHENLVSWRPVHSVNATSHCRGDLSPCETHHSYHDHGDDCGCYRCKAHMHNRKLSHNYTDRTSVTEGGLTQTETYRHNDTWNMRYPAYHARAESRDAAPKNKALKEYNEWAAQYNANLAPGQKKAAFLTEADLDKARG